MGRNLRKTCAICLKTMRGDHLKGHMKRHVCKIGNVDEAETGASSVKYTSSNFDELEKNVLCQRISLKEKLSLEEI